MKVFMSEIFLRAIEGVLQREPSCYQPADFIARELTREGLKCTSEDVEQVIDSSTHLFEMAHGEPPMWRVRSRSIAGRKNSPSLYQWQKAALAEWEDNGCCGIVEAVTGTGKTYVGVESIRKTLEHRGKALVLVPTIELQNQWASVLRDSVPQARLGRRGNQSKAEFKRKDVIISVINSARDFDPTDIPEGSLLIADEVHRYGIGGNAKALHERFDKRLGLTATLERADEGVSEFLTPYFGEVVYRIGYREAIEQDVVAPFRVAFIGVNFSSRTEQKRYKDCEEICRKSKQWLVSNTRAPAEPFGEFMQQVSQMSENKPDEYGKYPTFEAMRKAQQYLKTFTEKRQILATTQSKLDALEKLVPVVKEAAGSIVFSETIEGCQNAAETIHSNGVIAEAIHSKHSMDERRDILNDFKQRRIHAVCAPRIFDEGIDVPDADFGIIVAASRQRRQMIQRMGRVLRKKSDGREARFAILYVRGTSEDPDQGAHETFIEEITDVASRQNTFEPTASEDDILAFLTI